MTKRVIGIFSHINDNVIGYDGKLVVTNKIDFNHFRAITDRKVLLVGYKTAKEIMDRNPNGLRDRDIAILVSDDRPYPLLPESWRDIVTLVDNPEEFINKSEKPVVIAGGIYVFNRLHHLIKEWHVTHFDVNLTKQDNHFYLFDEVDETKVSRMNPLIIDSFKHGCFDVEKYTIEDEQGRIYPMTISHYLL